MMLRNTYALTIIIDEDIDDVMPPEIDFSRR